MDQQLVEKREKRTKNFLLTVAIVELLFTGLPGFFVGEFTATITGMKWPMADPLYCRLLGAATICVAVLFIIARSNPVKYRIVFQFGIAYYSLQFLARGWELFVAKSMGDDVWSGPQPFILICSLLFAILFAVFIPKQDQS